MATMNDVARHAGVSAMTVSNVINDRPHVREQTRARVLEAIDELGYSVNATARSLRRGRTGTIVLALPEIDRPYFSYLSSLVIERAARDDYVVVVEQTGAVREGELDALTRSRLGSYDGLILSAVHLSGADAALFRTDLPVVVLGERTYSEAVDHVVMANEDGGALAAEHLVARGARRLAMLGGVLAEVDEPGVGSLRAAGFHAGARRAGVDLEPHRVIDSAYSLEGGYEAAVRLIERDPSFDGLFCATDLVAIGAMRALRDRGLEVPVDVRVVGFDDIPLSRFLAPSLTSIAPDHEGMVDAAVSMLTARIAGEQGAGQYREVTGQVHLVERESTASAPTDRGRIS